MPKDNNNPNGQKQMPPIPRPNNFPERRRRRRYNFPDFPDYLATPFDDGPIGKDMPSGPPPRRKPEKRFSDDSRLYAIDPRSIRNCRYKYTYIWLEDGSSFWAWLVYVGRRSVSGYRWIGYRWIYFGTDLDNISSFVCY